MAVELPLDLCCDFFSEFDTNKRVVFILVLLCVCTNIYEIVVCVFHSAAVYLNSSIGIFLLSWHVVWGGPYRGRFVNEHYVRLPISNRGYERYFFFFFSCRGVLDRSKISFSSILYSSYLPSPVYGSYRFPCRSDELLSRCGY